MIWPERVGVGLLLWEPAKVGLSGAYGSPCWRRMGREFHFLMGFVLEQGGYLGEFMTFLDKMEYSVLGKTLLGGF